MALITVTVKAQTTARRMTVTLDNVVLPLKNGTGSRDVQEGTHTLGWTVEGKGSSYSIEVTTPPSAVFQRTVKQTGKEISYGTRKLDVH